MEAHTPEHLLDERPTNPDRPGTTPPAEKREKRRSSGEQKQQDTRPSEKREPSWGEYLRLHPWAVTGVIVALVILIVAGIAWWLYARQYESTDDAFIDARIIPISAQASGAISEVDVTDNQVVEAGTLLMRLDDRTYRAQLAQAKAQLDEAQANVANLGAQIDEQNARVDQAKKQVVQAQAALTFAQQEFDRYEQLAKTGSGTVQQAQQSRSNLVQAQATYAGNAANEAVAEKQISVLDTQRKSALAQVEGAQAQLQLAETNLSYTTIVAPVAGRITKLTAARGVYTTPGQALSMFVPREIWITANFKETQLAHMSIGQPVDLRIDAFPDRAFHGRVDSIQAGSGTAFSLLPAENATGNYVKVVQRVPVKITFDAPPGIELGPGMSVVPTVKVR
jgi:membrane fusion protein (multidrug efflux system)